jgi:hypothetical protein
MALSKPSGIPRGYTAAFYERKGKTIRYLLPSAFEYLNGGNKNMDKAVQLLKEHGDLKCVMPGGRPADDKWIYHNIGDKVLHFAYGRCTIKEMEELIDAGADLNHASIDHDTVLHLAVRDGNLLMVDMLLNRGAEVDDGNQGTEVSSIQEAVLECADPKMKALLHKYGVQFTEPDKYDADNDDTKCDHCGLFEKNNGHCERVVKDSNGKVILKKTDTDWQKCLDAGWSKDYENELRLCPNCTDKFQRCCCKCGEKYSALVDNDDFSNETDWKQDKHGDWSCTDCQEGRKRKRNRKKKTSGKKKTSRKKSRK